VLTQGEICASLIVPSVSGAADWRVLSNNEDDTLNIACKLTSTILCDWHYLVVCQHNSRANFILRQMCSLRVTRLHGASLCKNSWIDRGLACSGDSWGTRKHCGPIRWASWSPTARGERFDAAFAEYFGHLLVLLLFLFVSMRRVSNLVIYSCYLCFCVLPTTSTLLHRFPWVPW